MNMGNICLKKEKAKADFSSLPGKDEVDNSSAFKKNALRYDPDPTINRQNNFQDSSSAQPAHKGKLRALYDYDARAQNDLRFRKGDILLLLDDKWFMGQLSRKESERLLLADGHKAGVFLIRESETSPADADGLCCQLTYPCPKPQQVIGLGKDAWEISRDTLEKVKRLGAGQFGEVWKGMANKEVLEQVENGYRMPKPRNCPDSMYEEMRKTWDKIPQNRPTFEYLFNFFDDFFISTEPNYKDCE
ncbi:hypothetical protein KUTeg_017055 [Tegillarca granosa]|uniref:SH2 domain-containing protein n=1 Tax=Tegillarca granosa TaxID=220873 RepID=A0ABQ9ESY4_TEGGR|nr:hypothetical protein KUTeg_017055 [Tegillarca granosa]